MTRWKDDALVLVAYAAIVLVAAGGRYLLVRVETSASVVPCVPAPPSPF
jgi:hypothetical protein